MLDRIVADNGVVYYRSPLLHRAGVAHAFTTRIGGVSEGPFTTLNLGNPPGAVQDSADNLDANHHRVNAALGCESKKRRWVRQVHGCVVSQADESFVDGSEADALVTTAADDLLVIRIADCVPVLFATSDGRFVAAAHAGWRGVVSNIVSATVERMKRGSAFQSDNIHAAIGPCIGFNSFEVGPEVWNQFRQLFGHSVVRVSETSDRGYVDLASSIEQQLMAAGIPQANIDRADLCTVQRADEFFSHRRDQGITGRMAAFITPVDR